MCRDRSTLLIVIRLLGRTDEARDALAAVWHSMAGRQRSAMAHVRALRDDAAAHSDRAFASQARGETGRAIDNDGDVDMVITINSAPARLLLNGGDCPLAASRGTVPTNAHWLELALSASTGNRYGIGARVGIVRQGQPTLWRRVRSDGSYLRPVTIASILASARAIA